MPETSNPAVFATGTRWAVSAGAVVFGAAAIGVASGDDVGRRAGDDYVLLHAVTALVFLLAAMAATAVAIRRGPEEYRTFWRRWLLASAVGTLASAAAIGAVVTDVRALLVVDVALIVASVPVWVSATVAMSRAQAGRRSVSVDLLDALTALLVLGAPGVLLVAEPLQEAEQPLYAVPFALVAVTAPMSIYLSLVNLCRIPKGERAAQGIGAACAGLALVNLTMQLARLLGGLALPIRAFVAVHVLNFGLLMATSLWAHRRPTSGLARLPLHRQVRKADAMTYVSAVALPIMVVLVYLGRNDRPWGVWFLLAVVLAVVALNAVRYAALSRETRRLYAGIAGMAEERRELVNRLLRGLEDDRHRTAAELHSQVVGSLAALTTLAQLAHVALPGESALTVTATVEQLQGDLSDRAEHLRRLMLAVRPPAVGDDALAAGLLAVASQRAPEGAAPAIRVAPDPALRLDWATMTIVYRIAQEAVLNAVQHAAASRIDVRVAEQAGRVVVEVTDDGAGFEPTTVRRGSGVTAMEQFTQLAGGRLAVRSSPGQGTSVRAELGRRRKPTRRRHLRAVD